MKWVISILFLFIFSFSSLTASETLYKAHELYDKGDFNGALGQYQQFIKENGESAEIFYNLGNIYYRQGELGKSLFYFYRASEFLPRDPDVKFNLNYLMKQTKDQIGVTNTFWDKINPGYYLNYHERIIFLTLFGILFWTSMIILLYKKNVFFYWLRNGSFLIFIYAFIGLGFLYFTHKPYGVVIQESAKIYSSVGQKSVHLFSLHEGALFKIVDRYKKSWLRISLPDGKKGWIQTSSAIF
jgi:tetratricopeptide (TPR) repeat protein